MKFNYLTLGFVIALTSCASQPERVNTLVKTPLGETQVLPPENCPDWSRSNGLGVRNKPSSNFGCSTVNNFGVMVDNPEDLVHGRGTVLGNGATAARAVSAYESGTVAASSGSSSSSSSGQ